MTGRDFGVRVTTSRPLAELEAWLSSNCRGRWSLHFEGLAEDMAQKVVSLYFKEESDRQCFKNHYRDGAFQASAA